MRFIIAFLLCGGLMAQATLITTTTSATASATTSNIQLASTAGATPGLYAYVVDVNGQPGELVLITSISGSTLTVSRGVGGFQRAHVSGASVTLGPLAAFKTTFPNGACVATDIIYTPWININTGIKYECTNNAWTATNAGGGGGGGGGTNNQAVRIATGADLTGRPRLRFDAATGAICTGQDSAGTTETIVTCGPDALRTVMRMTVAERATLVPSPASGTTVVISDGASSTDCTTGGGTSGVLCRYNGTTWVAQGGGGSAPAWERSTITSSCDTNFSGAGLAPGIVVPGNPSGVCGVLAGGTSPEGRYTGVRLSDFDHNGGVLIWQVGRLPTGLNLASATVWLSTVQQTMAQNPNANTLNVETRCLAYPYLGAATAGGWSTASTVAISTPTVDQVRSYELTGVALTGCAAGEELQVRVRFTGGAWFGNEDVHEIGLTIPRA